MIRLVDAARWRLQTAVFVVFAAAAAAVVGAASATSARVVVAVAAGLAVIALTARRPVVFAVIALLAVFLSQRVGGSPLVGGGQSGVSYSDAFLTVATFFSVPALLGTKELHRLRLAGWGVAIYLACLLPTVLLNASSRGYLEWLHRLVLLGGSLLVGAWIAREGKIRPALRWLAFIACFVAAATLVQAARHGWLNSAPFHLNKNFVGGLLATVLVVVFIARDHFPGAWWFVTVGIIGAGVIATHSRGGALAASVGLFLAFVLTGKLHRAGTKVLAVLVAAGLAVFIYTNVRGQLEHSQSVISTSSLGVRYNVERVTRNIWRTSPVYGVGLKYFNTNEFGVFAQAANNVVDNELAESGAIGLTGFVLLQGIVLSAGFLKARKEPLAAAGLGAVAGLLAHGMVDIYWTAGTVTLPFVIVGMALAREPSDQTLQPDGERSFNEQAPPLSTGVLVGSQQSAEGSAVAVMRRSSDDVS